MRRMYFGTTSTGVPILIFRLESSSGVVVSVMEFGAAVVSIETPDREGRLGPIVPGFDHLAPYLEQIQPQTTTLGRYAGRVLDTTLLPQDPSPPEPHALDRHETPYKLHRTASGFHNTVWWGEALSEGVRFHYCSPEGEEGYPGKLDCSVEYRLDHAGNLRVAHRATTDACTVVDLASRIHFNLRDGGRSSVLDHELEIAAEEIVEVDRTGIPTGHFWAVEGSLLDFRSPRRVGAEMWASSRPRGDYDDCYVLRHRGERMGVVVRLRDSISGRNLEIATTQPGIRLETRPATSSSSDSRRLSLGLCPQNFPDAANHRHFPSPALSPGSFYEQTTVYRFWHDSSAQARDESGR